MTRINDKIPEIKLSQTQNCLQLLPTFIRNFYLSSFQEIRIKTHAFNDCMNPRTRCKPYKPLYFFWKWFTQYWMEPIQLLAKRMISSNSETKNVIKFSCFMVMKFCNQIQKEAFQATLEKL